MYQTDAVRVLPLLDDNRTYDQSAYRQSCAYSAVPEGNGTYTQQFTYILIGYPLGQFPVLASSRKYLYSRCEHLHLLKHLLKRFSFDCYYLCHIMSCLKPKAKLGRIVQERSIYPFCGSFWHSQGSQECQFQKIFSSRCTQLNFHVIFLG